MTWLNGFFLLPQANLREASLGVSCPFFPFARGSAALPHGSVGCKVLSLFSP